MDYAQVHKIYGATNDTPEARYSPGTCIGCEMKTVIGDPDYEHVSTSFAERQNLNMRMHMRRFTRLTNAFSKKIENHAAAISLYFAFYNFCRIHQTLRVTPAMESRDRQSRLERRGIGSPVAKGAAQETRSIQEKFEELRYGAERSYK